MSTRNPWWGTTLRTIGIVLMSLTAAFTLMGGAGTTCVALNPSGFGGKFAGIAPFQWLYILFVLVTLAVGIWGVRAVVKLIAGARGSYRQALIVLAAGLLIGVIHMAASRALRGSSMPVDMVYTTVLTRRFSCCVCPASGSAVVERPDAGDRKTGRLRQSPGAAGLLAQRAILMAPTHTIGGINMRILAHDSDGAGRGAVLAAGAESVRARGRESGAEGGEARRRANNSARAWSSGGSRWAGDKAGSAWTCLCRRWRDQRALSAGTGGVEANQIVVGGGLTRYSVRTCRCLPTGLVEDRQPACVHRGF
jgi:hypothetical protein